MNAHIDWMKHAALLDSQPSNRRLVQDITPRQQPSDMARLSWADQIESGAGMAGLIVWGVSVAALIYTLWSTS
jgi:hypothetical protein